MFLIKDRKTGEIVERTNYPNKDISKPLLGATVDVYKLVSESKEYNQMTHKLVNDGYEFTNEPYEGHEHIKIAKIKYSELQLSNEEIISKLNQSLGSFLDKNYPLWERAKHAGEGNYINWDKDNLTQEQLDRKAYIDSIYAWITRCRLDRDNKENELLTNGILPDFNWEKRP